MVVGAHSLPNTRCLVMNELKRASACVEGCFIRLSETGGRLKPRNLQSKTVRGAKTPTEIIIFIILKPMRGLPFFSPD